MKSENYSKMKGIKNDVLWLIIEVGNISWIRKTTKIKKVLIFPNNESATGGHLLESQNTSQANFSIETFEVHVMRTNQYYWDVVNAFSMKHFIRIN